MLFRFLPVVAVIAAAAALPATAGVHSQALSPYDWLQFGGSAQHDSANDSENVITVANVAQLKTQFHVLLPDVADGAPVYLSKVTIGSTSHDMLYMTTRDGHLLAVDAYSGATLWSQQYGPGTCITNNSSDGVPCYTTSSPAIDPNRQFVYSYGLDGKVHKVKVGDGQEIIDNHWPEVTTLKGFDEKESSALSIATVKNGTTYLYVAHSGYPGYAADHPGDEGDYQGHVTTINLATGAQNVFNTVCSDQTIHFVEKGAQPDCNLVQAAIWGRSGVVYDSETDKIYITTGNGVFDANKHSWGDTLLTLNPDGTGLNGNPLDTYTPPSFEEDAATDKDMGSSSPVILPPVPGSPLPHLGAQTGKDGQIRLLNLDNLSNHPGAPQPGDIDGALAVIDVPQGGEVHTQPAAWANPADGSVWLFVTTESSGASAIQVKFNGSQWQLVPIWQNSVQGVSPLIADGVLYYAGEDKTFYAFDPLSGKLLWQTPLGSIHWESPIVANGWVYITDTDRFLTGYALPDSPLTS
jgi:outer membrane protein assembly factor BamB